MKHFLLLLITLFSMQAHAQLTGTWATAAEFTGAGDMPLRSLANRSLREIVHVTIGGNSLRLQLSNEFSATQVAIKSVYIADAADSCDIHVKSARYLTFSGRRDVTIPAGETVFSDMLPYDLKPLQLLSITINYGDEVPVNATSHRGSRTTSYLMDGVSKPKKKFAATEKVDHWYNIAAIDVVAGESTPCIAVLGNSITDGRGSTTNEQNRWPDKMAEALGGNTAVLNLGIGGNAVLRGGLSEPAVKRFERDIMRQRGVKTLVIFQGVNDIGGSKGNSEQVATELMEAYTSFINQAHQAGMKVYLATITPFKGNSYYTIFHEAARQYVNQWIREQKLSDGIIDFDKLVFDPNDPAKMQAKYSDDWLHLNPSGYAAMGEYAARQLSGK
ncbi:MAG: SGNH/GDSL hydrolase family protein [Prevotella sp.]|nr:SGNH/GDSL hydrolase family protein [Prevotella sp.]